uniref:non-specific serine/threonine protein kinase n=1 Tax=Manihot esculenta TaxID=3983 RepID=A0A2C9W570_MANES
MAPLAFPEPVGAPIVSVTAPTPKATSIHTVPMKRRRRSVTSPPAASPSHPSTALSPLSTPLKPTAIAPSQPPSVRSRPPTIMPPPARPNRPPPSAFPLLPPSPPSSSMRSPPLLSLPLLNGSLPWSPKESHLSMGLIDGCVIGGVLLFLLLTLICICNKNRRGRKDFIQDEEHNYRTPSLETKELKATDLGPLIWFLRFLALTDNSLSVQLVETFSQPPLSIGSRGSLSMYSGSEYPLLINNPCFSLGLSSGSFTYDELVAATDGFSETNLIGEGGFGYVHKGYIRNGQEVAIKQLKDGSRQGEREFRAEVEIISRAHHKHLVSVIGYCIAGTKRLIVYEFVPNNTLEFHLHGIEQPVLEWATRLKIAIGSAKGVAYLHEDCNPSIVHRDIKAANILLDHKFEAKVSDFGLARSFTDRTIINHISTQVVGTFGYLAPEYASCGRVTEKSDVYSYGIVLLELITGRPPISNINPLKREALVSWARPLLNQSLEYCNFEALVDPRLENNYNTCEMASMVACAAACVRHSSWLRPRMSQIVRALEGDISAMDVYEGTRPGHSTFYGSTTASIYDNFPYNQHIKKHNMELTTWWCGTSGYSGSTSEYGLNPSRSSSDTSSR